METLRGESSIFYSDNDDCCEFDDPTCWLDEESNASRRRDLLDKRSSSREFVASLDNGQQVTFVSFSYSGRSEWPSNSPIMSSAYTYADEDSCLAVDIERRTVTTSTRTRYQFEHILELNTIRRFIQDANRGRLPSGATAQTPAVSASFFTQALDAPILANPPPMTGGVDSYIPIVRVMNTLGSRQNRGDFVYLLRGLNSAKVHLWVGNQPYGDMENAVRDSDPGRALRKIRSAIMVIHYLNHPDVQPKWVHVANSVRAELVRAEDRWSEISGNRVPIVAFWDEWIRDFMRDRAKTVRDFVAEWTKAMRLRWDARTDPRAVEVLEIAASLYALSSDLEIFLDGLEVEPVS